MSENHSERQSAPTAEPLGDAACSAPESPSPQTLRLAKTYDVCLLGALVSPYGADRYVYSLRRLIQFEMGRLRCTAAEARSSIAEEFILPMARLYGDNGPAFVNDELVDGSLDDDEAPKIILPPDFKS